MNTIKQCYKTKQKIMMSNKIAVLYKWKKTKTTQIGKLRLGKTKRGKKDKIMQYDIYIMTFYIRIIYNNEVNKHFMSRLSPVNCEYGLYCIIIKDKYQI